MYTPRPFVVDDAAVVRAMVRRSGFGHLVSSIPGESPHLQATPIPFVIDDELTTVRAHVARANPLWRSIDSSEGLLIVAGVDAYVSPNWYPSKTEHHRVVPTWNYEVVHLRGTVSVRDDEPWKLRLVSDLTDHHEQLVAGEAAPWQVSDAPDDFIASQLRAIVGIEMQVSAIDAKQKLSQNKPAADRAGTVQGLSRSDRDSDRATARLMET